VGEYSKAFLNRFPDARVFLFEPSIPHLERARAALPAGARIFDVALSERDGSATLYKDAKITGLASLTKRNLDHLGISMQLSEPVQCRTLDGIMDEEKIEYVDLLKIDVEGHELDVLKGGRRALESRRIGLVQFEFGGCNLDTRVVLRDFFQFLQPLGFTLHLIRPFGDLAPLPRYQEAYEQYQTTNYLAVRSG
jgi:FkbM family methyltransferase